MSAVFDELIADQRRLVGETRLGLFALMLTACPGPHRFVQHRDGLPPWCGVCRFTEDGQHLGALVSDPDTPSAPRIRPQSHEVRPSAGPDTITDSVPAESLPGGGGR